MSNPGSGQQGSALGNTAGGSSSTSGDGSENKLKYKDIPASFHLELSKGMRFLGYQLQEKGFTLGSTLRDTDTNHGTGEAIDFGDAANPNQQQLWNLLLPIKEHLDELFGPTRVTPGPTLMHFGEKYVDAGLQADHEDHIHVAVKGDKLVHLDGSFTGGDGGSIDGGMGGGESLAKAAAFATFFQLSSTMEKEVAISLEGEKSLMNDKPLFPFIQQLTEASLRNFQSMPNGNFFAFYPDYFGGMGHRTPYWSIRDTEIIDGSIDLSDDTLATHVFIIGDNSAIGDHWLNMLQTSGVVTIFNAFMVDFLDGNFAPKGTDPFADEPDERVRGMDKKDQEQWAKKNANSIIDKDNAIAFLRKYGARPHVEEMPMVRHPYYEMFLAYQRFCLLWASQFRTTFELTFMPEIFPGGIVEFPDHKLQCYVEEVSHNCSFEGGFTTSVVLSAPASTDEDSGNNINKGMIRAKAMNER